MGGRFPPGGPESLVRIPPRQAFAQNPGQQNRAATLLRNTPPPSIFAGLHQCHSKRPKAPGPFYRQQPRFNPALMQIQKRPLPPNKNPGAPLNNVKTYAKSRINKDLIPHKRLAMLQHKGAILRVHITVFLPLKSNRSAHLVLHV